MRILVTGGAGYIGSATVRELVNARHHVIVLDTLEKGHEAAVHHSAELVVGDVGDRIVLDRVLPGCDAVVHHADNVTAPTVMLDAMVDHGVDALVFSSTAAVYGRPETVPIPEDAATAPINAYGASKLAFEQLLGRYAEQQGLRSICLRYFNAAGAWPDWSVGEAHQPETHLIPRVLRAMLSGQTSIEIYGGDYDTPDGTCVRDYIHICDLARAHRLSLERLHKGGPGGVFNLGCGCGYSNLEIVAMCADVVQCEVEIVIGPRRAGDPARLVASNERAIAELGWEPRRDSLLTIVSDAWRWHRSHPGGYQESSR